MLLADVVHRANVGVGSTPMPPALRGGTLNTGRDNPAARESVDPEKDLAGVGEPRAVDRIPMTPRVRQTM